MHGEAVGKVEIRPFLIRSICEMVVANKQLSGFISELGKLLQLKL
jgi:hypothetical protein